MQFAIRVGLLTLTFIAALSAQVWGQSTLLDRKLRMEKQSGSLLEMLGAIEANSGVHLSFANNALHLDRRVALSGKEKTLGEHLESVLTGEAIQIVVREDRIILAPSQKTLAPAPPPKPRRFTLKGYVRAQGSGEALIGAAVYEPASGQGAFTNEYGFFSLTLPAGPHELVFQSLGFDRISRTMDFSAPLELVVELESNLEVGAVEIQTDQQEDFHDHTVMGKHSLNMEDEGSLPVLLGEADVMKTMQLLPGIHGGADGAAGFYVRGGSQDQNLVQLDGVPVYNPNHMLGVVSVFNSAAVMAASVRKGDLPARYGGRLSSQVDVRMKEGNKERLAGEVGMGLLSGRASLEGPIANKKGSFFLSGRRTWLDLLAVPLQKLVSNSWGTYSFHDLNAKVNWQSSPNNRFYLSGYLGRDKFLVKDVLNLRSQSSSSDEASLGWGNQIAAFRWNHIFGQKLFSNTSITFSRYNSFRDLQVDQSTDTTTFQSLSFNSQTEIQDWAGRIDFDFFPNPRHVVKFGGGSSYHSFTPTFNRHQRVYQNTDTSYTLGAPRKFAHESFLYIEDEISLNSRWGIHPGAHIAVYMVDKEAYIGIQPRFSARYRLDERQSFKFSAGHNVQFIHLLTNPGIGLPTDLWVPTTGIVRPAESEQISAGYYRTLGSSLLLRVETFYKRMRNLLEYEEGYNYVDNSQDWENRVEVGKGWSYGAEVMVEKTKGKLTGWVAYTWSKTERQFENLNFGEPFPFRYDRRHDLNFVLHYRANQKLSFGVVWVYGTGNAMTLGIDRFQSLSTLLPSSGSYQISNISQRNNFRTPPYHRLDLSVNLDKETSLGQRRWSFGLYNAYSRVNPSFIFAREKPNGSVGVFSLGILPVVPLVAYRLRF